MSAGEEVAATVAKGVLKGIGRGVGRVIVGGIISAITGGAVDIPDTDDSSDVGSDD